MNTHHYRTFCCALVTCLLTLAVQAQDVVIRRNTTTTTTTTSTTTVSKPKPKPSKPTTGTLSITSTPSGTVIKIDGKYMGETPLTLEKQKAGSYSVTFSAEGYETTTKKVTVTAGQTATCSATLTRKQAQPPVVSQPSTPTTSSNASSASSQTITANGVSFKMIRVEGQGLPFYIGETEVTQALWQAVMGSNPSRFKGSNRPVESVSWNDCKEFISRLNALTGKKFRLPKESEWEFAAKGGNKSHGYEYSGSNEINDVAWYDSNACNGVGENSPDYGTHNVKTKMANELGIYDMTGNVWEWCEDLYDSSGSGRVGRGGSWFSTAGYCRVSHRCSITPVSRIRDLGLRLAL